MLIFGNKMIFPSEKPQSVSSLMEMSGVFCRPLRGPPCRWVVDGSVVQCDASLMGSRCASAAGMCWSCCCHGNRLWHSLCSNLSLSLPLQAVLWIKGQVLSTARGTPVFILHKKYFKNDSSQNEKKINYILSELNDG